MTSIKCHVKFFVVFLDKWFFSRLICLPMFWRYTMWWSMGSLGLAFVFTWYQSKCHWLELIWLAFRSFARGGRYWSCFSAIVSSHINTTSLCNNKDTLCRCYKSLWMLSTWIFAAICLVLGEAESVTYKLHCSRIFWVNCRDECLRRLLEQIKISLIPCIFHFTTPHHSSKHSWYSRRDVSW